MIESVVPGFKLDPPDMSGAIPFPDELTVVNVNPQCGPLPIDPADLIVINSYPEYIAVGGPISSGFLEAQIQSRPRPHLGFLHLAIIVDEIATATFPLMSGERYGERYRYVDIGTICAFHVEAFIRNSLPSLPPKTIFVDGYEIWWEVLPLPGKPMVKRGIYRLVAQGVRNNGEKIDLSSLEGYYFRRRGALSLHASSS